MMISIEQFELRVKTGLLIIFTSFSLSNFAQNYKQTNSYLDQLFEINKEWLNHVEVSPKGIISFSSDEDRIQLHLNLVIENLKSKRPENLNSTQLEKRLDLLDGLQQYANKKIFPVNISYNQTTLFC